MTAFRIYEHAEENIAHARNLRRKFMPANQNVVFIDPEEPVLYSYPKKPRFWIEPTTDRELITPLVALISMHYNVAVSDIFKGHEAARKARAEAVYYIARTNPGWSTERVAKSIGIAPRTVKYILADYGVTMSGLRASMVRVHRETIRANRAKREDAMSDTEEARQILKSVAALHCVKVSEIMADNRMAHVSAARHAAVGAIAENFTEWTLHRIGRFFGRDHSTIVNSLRIVGVRRGQA